MNSPPSAASQQIYAPNLFAHKRAIITGGGSGIGLATALELVGLGAAVAICGRDAAKLERATKTLLAHAPTARILAQATDIREPSQVDAFVSRVGAEFGGVDILVNNAGGQFPAPATAISPNGFAAVVRNNLLGTYHFCHAVGTRLMIPAKHGCIINITANVARGFPGMAHTGAARAGVENLTMSLAVEWAQHGVRVNAIAPGIIESTGTQRYPAALLTTARQQTPLGRTGTCEEVAAMILFLASPAAQFVTGTVMRVDGGGALWGDIWQIVTPPT